MNYIACRIFFKKTIPLVKLNFRLVGKAISRLPHIWKRNMAAFVRQVLAAPQMTQNFRPGRNTGAPPRQIWPCKREQTKAQRRWGASPTKRVPAPEPAAEPESHHSHSNFLLQEFHLSLEDSYLYLFVYNWATVCQSNVCVPIVTVSEKLYVLRNTQKAQSRSSIRNC